MRTADGASHDEYEFGGVKIGSAFFGFLTASGLAVLLTALAAAAGIAIGLAGNTGTRAAARQVRDSSSTVAVLGGLALLAVLFLAYYCGGYVAGRMARFDGARQGIAVWGWAVALAIVVAGLGAIARTRFNILAQLNGFPRIPLNESALTAGGIVSTVAAVGLTLVAAILGGMAGTRSHTNVDATGPYG